MHNGDIEMIDKTRFYDAHARFQRDCGCDISHEFFEQIFNNATNDPTLNTFPGLNIKEVFLKSKGRLSVASKNLFSEFNDILDPLTDDAINIAGEVETEGYYEIPSFFSEQWAAEVREELSHFEYFSPANGEKYNLSDLRNIKSNDTALPSVFGSNLLNPVILEGSKIFEVIQDSFFSSVASKYFESQAHLVSLVSFFTRPKSQASFSDSELHNSAQKFHFDYSNLRFLKVFIYLSDIPTKEHGAHEFVTRSHANNFLYPKNNSDFYKPGFREHPNGQLEGLVRDSWLKENFAPNRLKSFTLPAGSVIFEDTSGLHRGGYCATGNREMLSLVFAISNGGAIEPKHQATIKSLPSDSKIYHLGCFDQDRKPLIIAAYKGAQPKPKLKLRIKRQINKVKNLLVN